MLDLQAIFNLDHDVPTEPALPAKRERELPEETASETPDCHWLQRPSIPPEDSTHWPAELQLAPADIPLGLSFGPHHQIVDRCKFLAWLQADIRRGPTGPRARYGAMQADLQLLRDRLVVDH